ncbi:MAG TPA: YceI family protein [Chitinophagaceae bacterium]|nr:YceI family protein [Chitinophagaceae bacterium]
MNKYILSLATLAFLASCQSAPEGQEASTTQQQEASKSESGTTFTIDQTASLVTFVGTKPVGTHTGTFTLSTGSLKVDNGNITAGSFEIDIQSMKCIDKDTAGSYKLIGHLLSPDFFDVAKFAKAKFEVTACEAIQNNPAATHQISGNLTLKDSTQNITFPAKVNVNDAGVTATADFNIDRTKWGLFYGNDKSLGDKFIYPEVKIMLNITAKK